VAKIGKLKVKIRTKVKTIFFIFPSEKSTSTIVDVKKYPEGTKSDLTYINIVSYKGSEISGFSPIFIYFSVFSDFHIDERLINFFLLTEKDVFLKNSPSTIVDGKFSAEGTKSDLIYYITKRYEGNIEKENL